MWVDQTISPLIADRNMFIKKIMASIYRSDAEAEEAALALGLLIEREKLGRQKSDDKSIRTILGERLANRRLSETELTTAVDELIQYITETPDPHPMAVWALTKSYEPCSVRPLINLLNRFISNPDRVHLAYQALVGIIPMQDEEHGAAIRAAIRRAAQYGYGEVKETATDYLESFLN